MITRRQILMASLAAPIVARAAERKLKILILGGTGFLGPHLVEVAKQRGHTLTLFNRGKTRAELFPELEKLRGDRKGQLDALKGRKWDAVFDDSGYIPKYVKMSADLLAPNIGQYVFVSSISVYPDDVKPHADETAPVQKLTEPNTEEVMKYYGPLKAACEQAAQLPGKTTVIRPGLIVGPGDNTDRFTYWPVRMDRGGEAVAPGDGSAPAQFIDVRDLAAFMVRCVEEKTLGTFNCVNNPLTMKELLAACKGSAKPVWIPEKFLTEQKVQPWMDLPVWTGSEGAGFSQIDSSRAQKAGLKFMPVEQTCADTLAYWKTLPEERRKKPRAGLSPEREQQVLAAWKAK